MKLFEFQVKEIFKQQEIPIPNGILITDISQLASALKNVGLPCVLKSQVLMGGRGKAGLVQLVKTHEEAEQKAKALFSSPYKVKKILVEQAVDIADEIYLSVTVDPAQAKALLMVCAQGGVDIEQVAASSPEKIIREYVDINLGLQDFQVRNILLSLNRDAGVDKQIGSIIRKIYQIFITYDAELVEINPLFITSAGTVVCGDGKLLIDDNSSYRHQEFAANRDYYENENQYIAAQEGIPYLEFDGDISLMCAGAGLTTTVYDLVNYEGGTVANYLEFGGPNYKKSVKAMELCLANKSKVILIVSFGTIARADIIAGGVVEAVQKLKPDRPVICCIRGTNEEQAYQTLSSAGLECFTDTEEAVKRAVEIAGRRKMS